MYLALSQVITISIIVSKLSSRFINLYPIFERQPRLGHFENGKTGADDQNESAV